MKSLRNRFLITSIVLGMLLILSMSNPAFEHNHSPNMQLVTTNAPAAIIWSDNFDDGNMDGWYTHEISGQPPNFTIVDGVVYSEHGEDLLNVAAHESSVAHGTWSFDVYINRLTGVEFISTAEFATNYSQDGYEVVFATETWKNIGPTSIQLVELYATSDTTYGHNRLDYLLMDPTGWHQVDITRDNTGYFCVYLNSTPVLEAIDTTVTTSNAFAFAFAGAFDNVSVSDSVDMDMVAPYFLQDPTNQVIAVGDDFSYKLNATDSSGPPTWEVNDTARFDVSGTGIVTNIVDLEPGVYGLEVTVTFSVTVEAGTPPPFDSTMLIVVGGGIAVIVVIVLVIVMKKRS
ncbi:MAG: hypothetical protein ACXABH_15480 [Candidatus Thorarchaeota archaeon]